MGEAGKQGLGILDCLGLDFRYPNAKVGKWLPIPLSCLHLAELDGIVHWKDSFIATRQRYRHWRSAAAQARRLQVNGPWFLVGGLGPKWRTHVARNRIQISIDNGRERDLNGISNHFPALRSVDEEATNIANPLWTLPISQIRMTLSV